MGTFVQPAGRSAWEIEEWDSTTTKQQFTVVPEEGGWAGMEPTWKSHGFEFPPRQFRK